MSESRLFKILYYLLDKGEATAPELAEKFEVSLRTIYRDIDRISSAGIPIYAQTGRNGGIRLYEDYVLDRLLLSKHEKEEIVMGLQSLSAIQYPNLDTVITKLGAMFQSQQNWISVDLSRWGSNDETELFESLKIAILEKKVIRFFYYSASKKQSYRFVEPLKLLYKDKAWYIYAYCLSSLDYRIFRLSRIKDIKVKKDSFTRSLDNDVDVFTLKNGLENRIEVELFFDKKVGYRLYDTLNKQAIEEKENGYLVKLTIPEDDWIYDFIMSFGELVTICKPLYLREKIIKRYYNALKKYKEY